MLYGGRLPSHENSPVLFSVLQRGQSSYIFLLAQKVDTKIISNKTVKCDTKKIVMKYFLFIWFQPQT